MCEVLKVSRVGYYRWLRRKPHEEDSVLIEKIETIFTESHKPTVPAVSKKRWKKRRAGSSPAAVSDASCAKRVGS